MFDAVINGLPAGWREVAQALITLIAWIPEWQAQVLRFAFWPGDTVWATIAGWTLLALPALLAVVALWSTMLSAYTLPFRSGRVAYLRTLTFAWWDAGRSIVSYWAGLVRLAVVLVGMVWGTLRYLVVLAGRVLKELVSTPAAAMDWTARRYFKPGVPWLAFVLILAWSALEATIFTFTLRPTMSEVLYDLTGAPPNPAFMTPILFMLLFMLIAGSFACIQVLTEAIDRRKPKDIVQMLFVEFFVMFFEVMFLYRELIDAITPWIAQQTGEQVRMGLWSTLGLACFGWIGIRGMTWFLFGRYGTPALMAILSRETLRMGEQAAPQPSQQALGWWQSMIQDFKREREWFDRKAQQLAEMIVLPVLQTAAAGVNFVLVLIAGRPAFRLPFASLDEAMARMPYPGRSEPAAAPARAAQEV